MKGKHEQAQETISQTQVIEWLNRFYLDKNNDAIRDLYSKGSFSEILSVGRRELSHSAFLAWLFDMNESHGLKQFPLLQLLKIVIKRGFQEHVENDLFNEVSAIYNESIIFYSMEVSREVSLKGGRPDLVICCETRIGINDRKMNVVVENKVYAGENDSQTVRYYKEYRRGDNDYNVFVYLTPKPKEELDIQDSPSCKCKSFIEINYQDVLNNILEPALEKDISDRTRFIIKEYIRCLGMPISDIENIKGKTRTIMATSVEASKMLADFWKHNEKLIVAAMATISEDPNQDSEVRKKVKDLLKAQASAGKDKTHYEFGGHEYNGKNAIIVGVLKYLMGKELTLGDINKSWSDFLSSQKGNLDDIIKLKNYEWTINNHLDEYTNTEIGQELKTLRRKGTVLIYDQDGFHKAKEAGKTSVYIHDFSPIEIENNETEYRYYNQWGWKNIDYFLKFFRVCYKDKHYPEIKLI